MSLSPRHLATRTAPRATPIAIAAALLVAGSAAQAFEFDTGNSDLSVRWDNTVRYNLGFRAESRDGRIYNNPLTDEGDALFDKGDTVANRLDLLSEFDLVWQKRYGFRVSGAGWVDRAYGSKSASNPALVGVPPSYIGNNFSPLTRRLYSGPGGEILDAFVFGGFDLGNVPVNAKAGRHTLYWGESLFLGGHLHSVAYAQNPLDLQKGFATPGTEAKELFRPLNQLSAQAQVTDTVSVAAQYLLEWEAARYPEGGTYLGPADFVFNGPDGQALPGLGFARRGPAAEPNQKGEFGLSTRWTPQMLDGTVGFYYRRFADKLPQTLITRPVPGSAQYNLVYADDIDLLGMSFAKNIAGVSVGAEFSKRINTPLNARVLGVAAGLPAEGETKGPRGDTLHALVNAAGVVPKTALFDAATWIAEVQWSQWTKVRSGANLFNAEGFAGCVNSGTVKGNKWTGCSTHSYVGTGVAFTPTWYQVFPGVDLSAPVTYSIGLSGNAATVFGGNQGLGNYSVGLSADVYQKYRFDLKYIDFLGHFTNNGTGAPATNGLNTFLTDRGFVSLTFKTTF